MDASLLASAGVGSSTIAGLFIAYKIFKKLNGHRLVSDCCGKKGEIGFVVRDMAPSPQVGTQSLPSLPHGSGEPKESLPVSVPTQIRLPSVQETSQEH
jgi:hypothetical protein